MFIQTEQTPNPATLKFLPDAKVLPNGAASFQKKEDAEGISPLAETLFDVTHVIGVFLGHDFVTVTKNEEIAWMDLKPIVLSVLSEYFESGKPVLQDDVPTMSVTHNEDKQFEGDEKHIVEQIKELLETRVRPAVAQDGGDIVFQDYDNGVVILTMLGSCAGCPSSTATLKMGIENMLRYYIPEVEEVRSIEQ